MHAAAPLALSALLLSACAGPKPPQPTARTVSFGEQSGLKTSLAALRNGRTLYVGRCGECHELYGPASRAPEAWPAIVADMKTNAELDDAQERDILAYLVAASAETHATAGPAR